MERKSKSTCCKKGSSLGSKVKETIAWSKYFEYNVGMNQAFPSPPLLLSRRLPRVSPHPHLNPLRYARGRSIFLFQ